MKLVESHVDLKVSIPGWQIGAVSGVAVTTDGDFYIIQRGANSDPIMEFDKTGQLIRSWGKGDFVLPHSVRVDSAGNVWGIDAGASRVIEYSASGRRIQTIDILPIPLTGSPFRGITDIAFAPNGNAYITDGYGNARVLEFTKRGRRVREWGQPGAGKAEFHLPHAIQFGTDGTLYVADRENGRVQEFGKDGKFLGVINDLGRCYSLALRGRFLWVSASPMDQAPGAPGWLIKIDAKTGEIVGHVDVPDSRQGHALDLSSSGDVVVTAGNGLIVFSGNVQ